MRPPFPYDASGAVWVRPPALVEAAAGVRATARFVARCAAEIATSAPCSPAFGDAQHAYAEWAHAWRDQLDLLVRRTTELSSAVEATAADYLRTDAVAAGWP